MTTPGGAEYCTIRKVLLNLMAAGCIGLSVLVSGVPAYAQSTLGDLRGVVRNFSGLPLSGAQIVVRNLDESTDRSVFSDEEGDFSLENLQPGRYLLTAHKEGLATSSATAIELRARQSLRVDMALASSNGSKPAGDPVLIAGLAPPKGSSADTGGVPVAAKTDNPPLTERERQLLDRLDRLEQRLAAMEAKEAKGTVAAAGTAQPLLASLAAPAILPAENPKPLPTIPAPETLAALAPGWTAPADAPVQPIGEANKQKKPDPFSDADWTWLNGSPRTKEIFWDTKFFTPEIRADVTYAWDNQHPADHSMGGSSELFREGEVQLEQLGVGGDFHWDNVRGRLMTQFGTYSTATVRNDPSYTHGEWELNDANRYLSEAYGGYHFNKWYGINVDAGIFMSYIGLFSYYNFDNWAYQPSYVSSNTPWFFQGVRVQIFPTQHLKIEPWFINGWQSYASSNNRPGIGGQVKWTPYSWMNLISNNYGLGHDDLYVPGRARIHTDNSIEIKYYDKPAKPLDKMAFSFTGDLGCEYGGGVSCTGDHAGGPKQSFVGAMVYNRFWFHKDQFGLTLGGGAINNPGRYLVLIPPINGETAGSAAINSPYFTENPGDKFKAWDTSLTFDWMPKQYITFRAEGDYRHADVPYWTGRGGITPPAFMGASSGTPNGFPTEYSCNDGTPSPTNGPGACINDGGVWYPSLVKGEFLMDFDILVKF